jgi:hypothetical protein
MKISAGYFSASKVVTEEDLKNTVGQSCEYYSTLTYIITNPWSEDWFHETLQGKMLITKFGSGTKAKPSTMANPGSIFCRIPSYLVSFFLLYPFFLFGFFSDFLCMMYIYKRSQIVTVNLNLSFDAIMAIYMQMYPTFFTNHYHRLLFVFLM